MGEEIESNERHTLAECERVIERGMQTFVEVGEALAKIRDSRLYRETHATFEAYCRERWGFTRMRASQLIESAKASSSVNNCLQTESQARELSKVEPERREEVVGRAREATGGNLTAKSIREASSPPDDDTSSTGPAPEVPNYVPKEAMGFYQRAWIEMEKISPNDQEREKALITMRDYCHKRIETKK